jgi:hypothetical protein
LLFFNEPEDLKLNEENLKNKILLPYLKELGLNEENLVFEKSFFIRLGKSYHEVKYGSKKSGRLGILVKQNDVNLFVLEVKSSSHNITNSDIEQVISYSRLLDNIAPFAIVTNGKTTKIFDTVTKNELTGYPLGNTDYVKNNYQIFLDPEIRLEAFLKLVEINRENLFIFCKHQSKTRMNNLRSSSVDDNNKKYIQEINDAILRNIEDKVNERRRFLLTKRKRTDNWFFQKFSLDDLN